MMEMWKVENGPNDIVVDPCPIDFVNIDRPQQKGRFFNVLKVCHICKTNTRTVLMTEREIKICVVFCMECENGGVGK